MEWIRLDSKKLARISYDHDARILYIEFPDGKIFEYHEVSSHLYENFVSADDPGKFFNSQIRSAYRVEQA